MNVLKCDKDTLAGFDKFKINSKLYFQFYSSTRTQPDQDIWGGSLNYEDKNSEDLISYV